MPESAKESPSPPKKVVQTAKKKDKKAPNVPKGAKKEGFYSIGATNRAHPGWNS